MIYGALWITHGEVGEGVVTKRRDRRAALECLTRAMTRDGRPASIVTDRLPSYRAAMQVIGNEGGQETRRWRNNRAEHSHQPCRRREGAMARVRDIKTLQKFTSVQASIHNHVNHPRQLNRRDIFTHGRAAALADQDQALEAGVLDGAHEAVRVGVQVRRAGGESDGGVVA